ASKRQAELVTQVRERVRHLRKLGASFVMCWHVPGECEPHLDYSDDYRGVDVRGILVDLVQQELTSQVCI
ncbi:MAG: hypothetical protein NTY19_05450, partial [Planctomycetota bacterium]|nr:hypothetical protein [Planctomycetota bacterium]